MPAFDSTTEWLRGEGNASDVVMSSRVRLARNLAGMPFMGRTTRAQRGEIVRVCQQAIVRAAIGAKVGFADLASIPAMDRALLVERHLISQQLSKGKKVVVGVSEPGGGEDEPRAVAFSFPDERVSIMVNEEDHLRLQVIRSGLELTTALQEAEAVDDRLESMLEYAYSPRFGYLTACPTNVGTGLRLSVMLHLPALKITGNMEKVERAAKDMSLAVRGFYGEGSQAVGDLYQLSNQTTLGKPESVLLSELEQEILPRVIDYERAARRTLAGKRRAELEDQCQRALGTLRHARLMTTEESMQLLSLVRLGVLTQALPGIEARTVNELVLLTQPAHLQKHVGRELGQDERRTARAAMLRQRLGGA
jgi:protein arginine kinase